MALLAIPISLHEPAVSRFHTSHRGQRQHRYARSAFVNHRRERSPRSLQISALFTPPDDPIVKEALKVDVRTNYSHRIQEALEEACVNVPRRQRQFNARICASLDSGEGKTDDARKALEQMFQGKTSLSKKWEEEIKKRELGERDGSGGSGGGGGGRGWGGGSDDMDGDSGGQEEPWDWEEAGQTFMATFALIIFYFSITHGPKQVFRLFRLFFRYVRQGFTLKSIPKEFLDGPDTEDEEDEDNGDEDSVLYSDEGRPSKLEPYVSVSDVPRSHVQDNHERHQEPEMDTMGKDSQLTEPPPQYKKGSRMAALQAQQKEKAMQYLADRDRRERGK